MRTKIAQSGQLFQPPISITGVKCTESANKAKNLCVAVDWFQVVTSGFIEIDLEDVQPSYDYGDTMLIVNESLRNGTKHHKIGFDLLHNGELFGQLLLFPRSKVLANDSGSFKVYNNILYQKGWSVRLESILHDLTLSINNITRLDIAIDGSELFDDWAKYERGEYSISGRADTNVYRSANRTIKQFNVGSKKSDKMVVGYNKSKELRSGKDKNKLYIKKHWDKFDIDTTKDVHRLELRLRNKAVKTIVDFEISKLEEACYLAGVMRSQMRNFFEYRLINENDSNNRRGEKLDVINWESLNYIEVNKQKKTSKANSVWSAQRYLTHGLRQICAGVKDGQDLFDNKKWKELNEEALSYGLGEWWQRLNRIIEKRDKAIISEMRYKNKEYMATGKTYKDYE